MSKDNSLINPMFLFSIFKNWLGVGVYVTIILTVLATIAESFGILLVLALLPFIFGAGLNLSRGELPKPLETLLDKVELHLSSSELLTLMIFAFVLKGAISFAAYSLNAYYRSILVEKLKQQLLTDLSKVNYEDFASNKTGSFVNLVTEQVSRCLNCFYHLCHLGGQIGNSFVYITFALLSSWMFGLIATTLGIVILILFKKINALVRVSSKRAAEEHGRLGSVVIELVQNLKYFKSTGNGYILVEQLNDSIKRLKKLQLKAGLAVAATQASREPIMFILVLIVFIISLNLFSVDISLMLVSLLFFYRTLNAVLGVQGNYQMVLENMGSIELIQNQLGIDKCLKGPISVTHQKQLPKNHTEMAIEFEDVNFKYKSGNNMTFTEPLRIQVQHGEQVAIIGQSGEGKTTIIDLMSGVLQPESGQIRWYGIPQTPAEQGLTVGYVSQDFEVFSGSLFQNVSMTNTPNEVNASRVIKCLQDVSLEKLLNTLPDGIYSNLGERGINLSGGQRQRIALARELFRRPDILFLDEATSSLDSVADDIINININKLKKKIPVVTISHKMPAIQSADKIIFLSGGKIIFCGSYEELSNSKLDVFTQIATLSNPQ